MIVGLIGFKQVGKSTAAKYLEEKYGFVRHNMKDALVAEIKQNFPDLLRIIAFKTYPASQTYNDELLNKAIDQLFVDKPPLMRALLQNYGTEVRRGDKDSYWTDQWVKKLWELQVTQKDVKVVTDDVRFVNEANVIKKPYPLAKQGILIRLTRPDITTGGSHASETEQLEIEPDYTIECVPGDHEQLYKELDKIIAGL